MTIQGDSQWISDEFPFTRRSAVVGKSSARDAVVSPALRRWIN